MTSLNYFSDYESLGKIGLNNSSIKMNEKIKLEFSVENSSGKLNGGFYSVQAKLYANQVYDFTSEIKPSQSLRQIFFEKFFICDFIFEMEQNLHIILNIDNKNQIRIKKTLGCIVTSRNSIFKYEYAPYEFLIIKAEKIGTIDELLNINFTFKMINLNNNFFSYNNNRLYYIIMCNNKKIYKSGLITNNGTFELNKIPTCLLQPFYTITFYNIQNQQISSFNKAINEIKFQQNKLELKIPILNNAFLCLYDNSYISKNYTFLDYIKSGIQIALSIGIDFTGSNGHPLDEGSLHSLKEGNPNDYVKAIISCGNIVAYYDYDQLFPVYGFGAMINSTNKREASMCFNLNFEDNPDIHTIDNVLKIYYDCIKKDKLTFSGPTEFAPLIKTVISRINTKNLFEYHILMILTDGVIDDLQQMIDALVEASFFPLSVIIIGIGNADFQKMEILDGDEVPLVSSTGKKRMRDLVQFVPFSKYQNDAKKLSMEVLAEIPRQIVEYYQFKNLNPEQIKILTASNKNQIINNNNNNYNYNINYNNQMRNNNANKIYTNNGNNFYQNNNNNNHNNNYYNNINNQNYKKNNSNNNNKNVSNRNIDYPSFEELQRINENVFNNLPIDETVYIDQSKLPKK